MYSGIILHDTLLGNQEVPVESETETINKVETKSWWKKAIDKLLGENVSAEEVSLVGKKVTINEESYEVIGVLAPNATLGSSTDNNVVIPIETALAN